MLSSSLWLIIIPQGLGPQVDSPGMHTCLSTASLVLFSIYLLGLAIDVMDSLPWLTSVSLGF